MAIAAISTLLGLFTVLVSSDSILQAPSYESEWTLMRSQDANCYYHEFTHGLAEVPIKVRVFVKQLTHNGSEFVYEAASGGNMWDDDKNFYFCGPVFVFNQEKVVVAAPMSPDHSPLKLGRILCTGSSSWGNCNGQVFQEALVKVAAWSYRDFPEPDYQSQWIHVDNTTAVVELEHSLGDHRDLYMMAQIRGLSHIDDPGPWYGEAVGASQDGYDIRDRGAMVIGYDATTVRVWKPNYNPPQPDRKPCMLCIKDGYYIHHLDRVVYVSEGQVRILGWRSLAEINRRVEFLVDADSALTTIDVAMTGGDDLDLQDNSLFVSVQIQALDGPNNNFLFPSFGLTPAHSREYDPKMPYGGVVSAVGTSTVRLFLPTAEKSYPVNIDKRWGQGNYTYRSKTAKVIITVYNTATSSYSPATAPWPHEPVAVDCEALETTSHIASSLGTFDTFDGCIPYTSVGPELVTYADVTKPPEPTCPGNSPTNSCHFKLLRAPGGGTKPNIRAKLECARQLCYEVPLKAYTAFALQDGTCTFYCTDTEALVHSVPTSAIYYRV